VTNNGGPPTVWQDVLWSFQALGNGDQALANLRANSGYTPEEGESRAHTFHWIRNLAALGTVDASVTANTPLYAVFTKNGARTYAATNLGTAPLTVTFSDGRTLTVAASRTATTGAFTWVGGNGTSTPPSSSPPTSPSPSVSPSRSPSSSPSTSPSTSTPPVGSNRFFLRSGPALSTVAGNAAGTQTVTAANGNWDGNPHNPVTYRTCGITGATNGTATQFALHVDAGGGVGQGIQARVSYDFTGGGTYGRVETYRYFATDPVAGTEQYTQAAGLASSSGTLSAMNHGCVRLEVWNAIGNQPTTVRIDATAADGRQSTLTIPYTVS
jgi:hypothetical protein